MLIQIHFIQNHSPANLNRDDIGVPKTCYFGGVLRSRISSQCLKRSIRRSVHFADLCQGVRTRRLAQLVSEGLDASHRRTAEDVMASLGYGSKGKAKTEDDGDVSETSDSLIYTTKTAIEKMQECFRSRGSKSASELAAEFAELISRHTSAPDMALSGRMLEPAGSGKDAWKGRDKTVEAALQVAHAISTHEARPEVDYYVAADDIPGDDPGAAFVNEALFASACFYKYFSIDPDQLRRNLGTEEAREAATRTIGAFIRAAALTTPSGKQNSFAAHNPPDGILLEFRATPISYANAFAKPVDTSLRDITAQSIAQLAHYVRDLDVGLGSQGVDRLWYSPNLRYPLTVIENEVETELTASNYRSLDDLVGDVVGRLGHYWATPVPGVR